MQKYVEPESEIVWNQFKTKVQREGVIINKHTTFTATPEEAEGILKILKNSDLIYAYKISIKEVLFMIEGHQKALVESYELFAIYSSWEAGNE